MLRGIVNEISPSGRNVGGSTITQQITRTMNVFSRAGLSSGAQRFVQKFKEWILAFRIEREFTKEEILDLYMNTSFFGKSSYGVVTAARTYFGKDLDELSIAEVALLAGIPNRPTDFNPVASVERATARRSYVLRRMNETGAITEAQYQAALAEPVIGKRYGTETQVDAPYVGEMVRAEMVRRFGAEAYTAGFKVTTTLDSRLQKAANRAMHSTLLTYDERHGYRGPLAHVDLPAAGGADKAASANELRALLEDHPNVVDYETAIVLAVEPQSARVFFADRGEQTVGFDAMSWAAPFVNDDAVGTKPTSVTEVLKVGDVVHQQIFFFCVPRGVSLVVSEQRAVHRAVRGLLQAAVERRRDFEARGVRLPARRSAPTISARTVSARRRVNLSLRARALAVAPARRAHLVLSFRDRAGLVHPAQHVGRRSRRSRPG